MKVLVTGATGQLARSLSQAASSRADLDVRCVGRPELALETPGSASEIVAAVRPDLVINAAAFTAVDQAEAEADHAWQINAVGAGEVAGAAHALGAPVIQLSTDYVFDGRSRRPYREDDPTGPINEYGRSKLGGEAAVRAANPDHLIVRTSWVFSPFGRNFVANMLGLAENRDEIRVICDQHGSPTSALDLADALLAVARRIGTGDSRSLGQTFHLSGSGSCSWADFATEIFAASKRLGGPSASVIPIASAEFPSPAARPSYSILDNQAFIAEFGFSLPEWRESAALVVERILAQR
ncbi:MAG: dTDP-4-dehydrorhamnose reductase [Pseudomonadota bacterium]